MERPSLNSLWRKLMGKNLIMGMTPKELERRNGEMLDETEKDFNAFRDGLSKDFCSICGYATSTVRTHSPCLHWLLRPTGVDKKHIIEVLHKFDYSRVEGYVRWAANSEKVFGNINDLTEEGTSNKVIEFTTRYRNLEWSVSCGQSDFEGHKDSNFGKKPHYHFQMKIDNRVFFDYSDSHIPFRKSDLLMFDVRSGKIPDAKWLDLYGMGMQGSKDEFTPDELINMMSAGTDDVENATYRTQTLLMAKKGETLSGDDLLALFKESKEKNVSFASLAGKMKNVGTRKVFISEGEGVPEKAARKKGRGSKRKRK